MTEVIPAAPAAAVPSSTIRVRGLTARTRDRLLVDGVDLDIPAGVVTALVGSSGSGKTTTALALMGERRPGGDVTTTVLDTGGARFGYVPQHPSSALNPALRIGTVLDDIARAGRRHGHPVTVADALARAGFADDPGMLRRYPHQLSGGQQQRLVIAQALLTDPTCLILDEPTTGQDPARRTAVLDEITRLARQGLTIVLVTHDLDAVRAVAQRVIVMGGGRVLETGDAGILPVAAPRIPQTRADTADRRPTRADARLILDAVSAGYRNNRVLQRFSLSLQPGECLALHGPSGCGKTTAARVVAGLHPPTAGRVLLDGHPLAASVRRRTRHQTAAIGYVFQDAKAAFDPYRSVWEQILRGPARLRGATGPESAAAARRALDQVGLAERITRQHPSALSGGEAQRAALARALAVEPSLLICDEVTTGLDPASRQRVLDILSDLVRTQRISLLMISHDGAVVDAISDRVVDMTLPATNGEPP